jgi:hypothetical protein
MKRDRGSCIEQRRKAHDACSRGSIWTWNREL